MPGDVALVAEQRVQVAGLVDQRRELLRRRRRPGFRAEPGDRLVLGRPRRRAAASPRRAAWSRTRAGAARGRPRAGSGPARRGLWARRVCRRCAGAPPTSGGSAAPGRRTRPPASCRPGAPRSARGPRALRAAGRRSSSRSSPAPAPTRPSAPDSTASRRRTVISTSGSSGMRPSLAGRPRGAAGRLDSQFIRLVQGAHRPGQRTSETEGSMQELPTIQPTLAPDLSPEEIVAISAEMRALAARAQRGDPRPQLPAARDPGRRRLHGRQPRALAPGRRRPMPR